MRHECNHDSICAAFLGNLDHLLDLAYLLTHSEESALACVEQAVVIAKGSPSLSTDQADAIARRMVIKVVLDRIAPGIRRDLDLNTESEYFTPAHIVTNKTELFNVLFTLNSFERSVFVLRACERYGLSDVAQMLRLSEEVVEQGWQRSLVLLVSRIQTEPSK